MSIKLSQSWWSHVIRGLVAILLGIALLIWPGKTILIVALLFGVYAIVHGLALVVDALQQRQHNVYWWQSLVLGLLNIAVGVIAIAWPGASALVILILFIVYILINGVQDLMAAIWAWGEGDKRWLLIIGGTAGILFSIYALLNPDIGAQILGLLIAIYAIISGIVFLLHGFQLRAGNESQS